MKSQNLIKWLVLPLLFIALAAAGFVIGRMTGSGSENNGTPSDGSEERTVLYWRAPMDPTEIYDAPGRSRMGMDLVPVYSGEEPESDAQADEKKILYWRAPMDPTEIYDAPGKSSMGMDLIPVYEDESGAESGGIITIDPTTVQNMGVRSASVERTDFSRTIRTVGEIDYDEERLYLVNSKISGWIEKLYVNFVGDEVTKGSPLMEIYSPELVSTQQEYLLAVANYRTASGSGIPSIEEDAARLLSSTRKRLEYWDIPTAAIENLERTGEIKKTILLEAPATGVVVKRNAIEGAFIKAGMDLFEIADLRSVWVHASFYDNEVPWISEGQQVEMELSYLPGRTYTGRVSYVYPYLREKARDVHVRLIFSNPNLDLKPGMYANVRLQGKTIPKALIVPSEAVVRSGARDIVFVVRGEGRFEPREIRIGEEGGPDNGYVRVISGLLDGEDVVTSAQFMLDSESRLQEAIQKMLSDQMNRSSPAGSPQSKEDSVSLRPTESVADVDSADPEHSMKSAESVPDSLSAEHNQNIQSSAATPSVPPAEHEHPAPPAEHEHPAPPAEHEHPAPPAEHEHPAPPVEHEHDSHSADSTNAA